MIADYRVIIGLEIHVQLRTESKLFCGCPTDFRPDAPNTQTCPVCLGLPGALPVMNRKAFDEACRVGLALGCDLATFTKWDRKQYYYPDLPKAYQISQYDLPFSHGGRLDVVMDAEAGESISVGIVRAHLEEDAGKNSHDDSGRGGDSKVDLNRCGMPLVEIVTEPDMTTPAEARRFMEEVRLLLVYLDVSDCNMQEGNLRCDVNLNLELDSPDGSRVRTPIAEIKNLNSFRNVELAAEAEIKRQLREFEETGLTIDAPGASKRTCGFDPNTGRTFVQRSKEDASDYRYFPDPDLLPATLTVEQIDEIRASLVEPPAERRARFAQDYSLSAYDATVIVDQGRDFADRFETLAQASGDGKLAANWMTQDVLREMKEREVEVNAFPIPFETLAAMLALIAENKLTTKGGRDVFAALLEESSPAPDRVAELVSEMGLEVVSDESTILPIIDAAIARNEKAVASVREGKLNAVGPLIGQVMGQLKGADAKQVRQMILDRIAAGE